MKRSGLKKDFSQEEKKLVSTLDELFDNDLSHLDQLHQVRIDLTTEVIVTTWSEALRWIYKERGKIELTDYLLPPDLEKIKEGEIQSAWGINLSRTRISLADIRGILNKLGEEKRTEKIDFPWGGQITYSEGKYILDKI